MSEIEQAIENLEYFIGGDCCDNQMDFLEEIGMGIAALREKAERERGCKWCKIGLRFECYLVDDDGHTASIQDHVVQTVIADFCPICGKRLEVEP